jgi:hypothetical protein
MCFIRILNKDPSFAEELVEVFPNLLHEKNQGLLLCTLHLGVKLLKLRPGMVKQVSARLEPLYATLKSLCTRYESNYTVHGVNDPFLQCAIIEFLKDVALLDEETLPDFSTQVLLIYNTVQNSSNNTARCLLYQIARCIMQVVSTNALKKIAINILGSFLDLKNKNFLFVSLNMLLYASVKYKEEIARFDKIIIKCAKEKDFTVKKMAIQILKNISKVENAGEILAILAAQLAQESSKVRAEELLSIAVSVLEKNSPTILSVIDRYFLILGVLKVGNGESLTENLFDLVHNTKQAQALFALKCVLLLAIPTAKDREALLRVCFWGVGEFYGGLTRAADAGERRRQRDRHCPGQRGPTPRRLNPFRFR